MRRDHGRCISRKVSGCSPVIAVIGAHTDLCRRELDQLEVREAFNLDEDRIVIPRGHQTPCEHEARHRRSRTVVVRPACHLRKVAFHVIDQAIRVCVSAYQHFSRGEITAQPISDMQNLIDYLQTTEAPSSLSKYQSTLLKALSDQRAFFDQWRNEGQQFPYGNAQTLGTHPRVQSASSALREAYGILISTYPGESNHNKEAFFDYHCALDFL